MTRRTPHTLSAVLLGATALAVGPALAQQMEMPPAPEGVESFEAPIIGADGSEVGQLILYGGDNGVVGRFSVDAGYLVPGWHAVHLHQVGDCADAPEFEASGGHITSEGAMHGFLHPEGPEAGDLANFHAGEAGSAVAEFATSLVTFEGDRALFDENGSALVIHETRDDHHTQPIGGAGGRVACAVIARR